MALIGCPRSDVSGLAGSLKIQHGALQTNRGETRCRPGLRLRSEKKKKFRAYCDCFEWRPATAKVVIDCSKPLCLVRTPKCDGVVQWPTQLAGFDLANVWCTDRLFSRVSQVQWPQLIQKWQGYYELDTQLECRNVRALSLYRNVNSTERSPSMQGLCQRTQISCMSQKCRQELKSSLYLSLCVCVYTAGVAVPNEAITSQSSANARRLRYAPRAYILRNYSWLLLHTRGDVLATTVGLISVKILVLPTKLLRESSHFSFLFRLGIVWFDRHCISHALVRTRIWTPEAAFAVSWSKGSGGKLDVYSDSGKCRLSLGLVIFFFFSLSVLVCIV